MQQIESYQNLVIHINIKGLHKNIKEIMLNLKESKKKLKIHLF